jgi:hypothetical protein
MIVTSAMFTPYSVLHIFNWLVAEAGEVPPYKATPITLALSVMSQTSHQA